MAGLYGAMKVQGLPLSSLAEQRFVVAGAGSAGMGVVSMICQGGPSQMPYRIYCIIIMLP